MLYKLTAPVATEHAYTQITPHSHNSHFCRKKVSVDTDFDLFDDGIRFL